MKGQRAILLIAIAITLNAAISCSPTTRAFVDNHFWPCLTDSEAGLALPMFENAVEADPASQGKMPAETTLVENGCRR
jgi:hypothetical protein